MTATFFCQMFSKISGEFFADAGIAFKKADHIVYSLDLKAFLFFKQYIHFFRHFSPEDYARLIANCNCFVGNSSSGIREGSYLGVPYVNIGTRQANRERAENCISADYNRHEIEDSIRYHLQNGNYPSSTLYGDGQAGDRISKILAEVDFTIQKRLYY